MKKRVLLIGLIVALLLSMTACGGFKVEGTWKEDGGGIVNFSQGKCPNLFGLGPGATYAVSDKKSDGFILYGTSTFGDYTGTYYVKIVDKNHMEFYYNSNYSADSFCSSFTRME